MVSGVKRMRAQSMIRPGLHYRRDIFEAGLRACGYQVTYNSIQPTKDDVLIIWNRPMNHFNLTAEKFEAVGARVIVAENGYLGKDWRNEFYDIKFERLGASILVGENEYIGSDKPYKDWYALSLIQHNGGGWWPYKNDPEPPARFDIPYIVDRPKPDNGYLLGLAQRGIGYPGVAMPRDWASRCKGFPPCYKMRRHRGKANPPLEPELEQAYAVFTWGSGAALKAIQLGIPCVHYYQDWIGAPASTYYKDVDDWDNIPFKDPGPMFDRLSWAMWGGDEIASGLAFKYLLQ